VAKRTARSSQLRFAAKLLFQFRVVFKGRSNQRRLCEERILVIGASSAEIALDKSASFVVGENSRRSTSSLEVMFGTTMVIYETDDSAFAASAVEALKEADIDSYTTGGRLSLGPSDPTICIHIRNDADYPRANEILIRNGAVVEPPLRLPTGWVAWAGVVLGSFLFCWLVAWLVA
jgi:hypothetical protein